MTLGVCDLQSDCELDSIRNSWDVFQKNDKVDVRTLIESSLHVSLAQICPPCLACNNTIRYESKMIVFDPFFVFDPFSLIFCSYCLVFPVLRQKALVQVPYFAVLVGAHLEYS